MHASCSTMHHFDINDDDKSYVLMNITLWFKGQSFIVIILVLIVFLKKIIGINSLHFVTVDAAGNRLNVTYCVCRHHNKNSD